MLLGTLGASLLRNLLTGKGTGTAGEETVKKGEGIKKSFNLAKSFNEF